LPELREVGAHERGCFARAGAGIDHGIARESYSFLLSRVKRQHRPLTPSASSVSP
jgi:hypothetical protein